MIDSIYVLDPQCQNFVRVKIRKEKPCTISGFSVQHSNRCTRSAHSHAHPSPDAGDASRLFELLLGSELVGVAALLLAAVNGTRRQTSVALAADPA